MKGTGLGCVQGGVVGKFADIIEKDVWKWSLE